jgi:hypothetical protein
VLVFGDFQTEEESTIVDERALAYLTGFSFGNIISRAHIVPSLASGYLKLALESFSHPLKVNFVLCDLCKIKYTNFNCEVC